MIIIFQIVQSCLRPFGIFQYFVLTINRTASIKTMYCRAKFIVNSIVNWRHVASIQMLNFIFVHEIEIKIHVHFDTLFSDNSINIVNKAKQKKSQNHTIGRCAKKI